MDQLCVNQNDAKEKSQEVPKMRNYYSSSFATLASIDGNLKKDRESLPPLPDALAMIVGKQIVYMFDDELVDGRAIAQTLGQVLKEIKNRERGNPIDGIYSTLGLLPYGESVEVDYKQNICKECKEKENNEERKVNCKHPEEQRTEFPGYFKEEIEERLLHVMKKALESGYGDIFSWHGSGNSLVPTTLDEKKGSTTSQGGLIVVCKCKESGNPHQCQFVKVNENSIEIK
ncbi:35279_t:CDS:2, partial [Racocetra persica]